MRPADAAWRGLDRPENRLVVTAVLRLRGELDLADLRARVHDRMVAAHPRFTHVARRGAAGPRWHTDTSFDVRHHVVDATPGGPCDDAELLRLAGTLVSRPLDPARPPWQLHLVHRTGGRSALVARFHHSLADGTALATVLLGLTDQVDGGSSDGAAPRRIPRQAAAGARAVVSLATTVVRLVSTVGEPATALRGPLGPAKSLALTDPIALEDVRRASRAHRVSINDVLLAATAGGLRSYLRGRGDAAVDLRVVVPVDLRAGAPVPTRLGNRFGIVVVHLPVGEPDRLRRLHAVAARTTRRAVSAQAAGTYLALWLVGVLPRPVRRLAVGLLENSASAVVTNVPGPRHRLTIGACEVDDVAFWVPTIGRTGLGVSLFSYAGTVTVGVAVDARLAVDATGLAAAIQDEIAALSASSPSSS